MNNITTLLSRLETKANERKKAVSMKCCKERHTLLVYADAGEPVDAPKYCPKCGREIVRLIFTKDCKGL